jgi:hypothetical protein
MATKSVETATPAAKLPKAEAIAKIAKHIAAIKVELEASQAQLKTSVKPQRYALNFQVNALKKQTHFWKTQITRLNREPKTEIDMLKEFGSCC